MFYWKIGLIQNEWISFEKATYVEARGY